MCNFLVSFQIINLKFDPIQAIYTKRTYDNNEFYMIFDFF